eukprot:384302_1
MGNKIKIINTAEDALQTYQKLISMDFDENVSMKASKKYPGNLEKAITFILEMEKNQIDKETLNVKKCNNMNNRDQNTSNVQSTDSCKNITKC